MIVASRFSSTHTARPWLVAARSQPSSWTGVLLCRGASNFCTIVRRPGGTCRRTSRTGLMLLHESDESSFTDGARTTSFRLVVNSGGDVGCLMLLKRQPLVVLTRPLCVPVDRKQGTATGIFPLTTYFADMEQLRTATLARFRSLRTHMRYTTGMLATERKNILAYLDTSGDIGITWNAAKSTEETASANGGDGKNLGDGPRWFGHRSVHVPPNYLAPREHACSGSGFVGLELKRS